MEQLNSEPFAIAAHRGYKAAYPENTLLAFKEALESGVDMIEFDLRLSKDKAVMIMHDKTIDRTTNGVGPISDFTFNELKQLDAGSWMGAEFEGLKIPTLQELCDLLLDFPDALLNVEIKSSEHALTATDLAIEILADYGYLNRSVFTCFDANVIHYIHDKYNLKTQGFPGEVMHHFKSGETGTYSKMWAVGIEMKMLTKERVDEFKKRNIRIGAYCPDDEEAVQYALDCGVSLVTSNELIPAFRLKSSLQE
jgi:glycerophosphoryl diester phosphodiesterase